MTKATPSNKTQAQVGSDSRRFLVGYAVGPEEHCKEPDRGQGNSEQPQQNDPQAKFPISPRNGERRIEEPSHCSKRGAI